MLCFSVRLFLLEDFPVNLLVKMWGFFSPIVLLPDDHNPSRRVEHRGEAADGLTARLHAASSRALSSASEVAPSVLRGQLVLWAARTGASWWARPWLRPRRRCPDFPPATGQSLSLRLACSPEQGGRLPTCSELQSRLLPRDGLPVTLQGTRSTRAEGTVWNTASLHPLCAAPAGTRGHPHRACCPHPGRPSGEESRGRSKDAPRFSLCVAWRGAGQCAPSRLALLGFPSTFRGCHSPLKCSTAGFLVSCKRHD